MSGQKQIEQCVLLDIDIIHPKHRHTLHLREEIAAPDKLLHILESGRKPLDAGVHWHAFPEKKNNGDHSFRRCGLYTMGGNDIFQNFHRMPFIAWFTTHWHEPFMISAPVYEDNNDNNDDNNIMWSVSCSPPLRSINLTGMNREFAVATMQTNNSYTVCNGLTIALALHRAGRLSAADLLEALGKLRGLVAPFNDLWTDLYLFRNVPMIADIPEYYALRDSDLSVLQYLYMTKRTHNGHFNNLYLIENPIYAIYTNPFSAIFPRLTAAKASWILRNFKWAAAMPDNCKPDFYGLFSGIVTGGGRLWRWWRSESANLLTESFQSQPQSRFLKFTLVPIFHLYAATCDYRRRHRLVFTWRQVVRIVGRERVAAWLIAYARQSQQSQQSQQSNHIPVALLSDVITDARPLKTVTSLESQTIKEFCDIRRRYLQRWLFTINRLPYPAGELVVEFMLRSNTLDSTIYSKGQ